MNAADEVQRSSPAAAPGTRAPSAPVPPGRPERPACADCGRSDIPRNWHRGVLPYTAASGHRWLCASCEEIAVLSPAPDRSTPA